MSEPLSAVEIEDVLTSIRRLVSEDLRPAARAPAEDEQTAARPVPEKARPALILTPALRVVPEPVPAPDPVPEPEPEAEPAPMPIEQVVASVGAAVPSEGQDWEPETGEPALAAPPDWVGAGWQDAERDVLILDRATPAEGIGAGVVQAEVIGGPDAAVADGMRADEMPADDAVAQAEAPDPSVEAEWAAAAEAEVIAGLERERSEADAAAGRGKAGGWAADGWAADGFDVDRMQVPGEISFDEEVLRDLVRDLIREELQGDLGERITRNIRKLVRAEIARALAAAELE